MIFPSQNRGEGKEEEEEYSGLVTQDKRKSEKPPLTHGKQTLRLELAYLNAKKNIPIHSDVSTLREIEKKKKVNQEMIKKNTLNRFL